MQDRDERIPNKLIPQDVDLDEVMPLLTESMMERLHLYGTEEPFKKGETLVQFGARGSDFFVILEGTLEVCDLVGPQHDEEEVVFRPGKGHFTGELDLFASSQIFHLVRGGSDGCVLRIQPAEFQRMLRDEVEIGKLVLKTFIHRRIAKIEHGLGAVELIGYLHSTDTLRLQAFLTRNGQPFRLLDAADNPEAQSLLTAFGIAPEQLPAIITLDQKVLANPRNAELADQLGISNTPPEDALFDVVVVGAGPGGLAAAVYAASEGLSTAVIETLAPGGQAGSSSRIENYLGFPLGISGLELAARAQTQAQKFGARMLVSRPATALFREGTHFRVEMEDGKAVHARSVVIATGARYRKLSVADNDRFEGQGIYYAATAMESKLCSEQDVIVVGAGNSAGQAPFFYRALRAAFTCWCVARRSRPPCRTILCSASPPRPTFICM